MDLAISAVFTLAALVGHFAITVWLFNRLHALGWPRRIVKTLEKLLVILALVVFASLACQGLAATVARQNTVWMGYATICCFAVILSIPYWLIPKLLEKTPAALVSNDTTTIDVEKRLGFRPIHGPEATLLAAFPGNELLKLAVHKKTVRLPGLPPALDGLAIAHLSDLHMTGQLGREYYDVVVDETNALEPDIIVITGDILEREQCLPWIARALGRLCARHGKFFILGNHEQRLRDVAPLRCELVAAGFTDLGGKCQTLDVRGTQILIAGTERPWFGRDPLIPQSRVPFGCPNPQSTELRTLNPEPCLRLLLSHTPDQLPFARRHQFHLMLAGHNHGGQIRFPCVGALITPSFYGSRYAGGLYSAPPTLLHVSRGLAGIHPIRLNCPPELPLLILKGSS